MFSQDEPDVEMVVIASVCLDSVSEPLRSVMCEIKDAHPVVLDAGGRKNRRKEGEDGKRGGGVTSDRLKHLYKENTSTSCW